MVHAAQIAPATRLAVRPSDTFGSGSRSGTPSRLGHFRPRLASGGGSFHAGAPIPSYDDPGSASSSRRRPSAALLSATAAGHRSSMHGYHTFPTQPPKTPGGDDSFDGTGPGFDASSRDLATNDDEDEEGEEEDNGDGEDEEPTPLPWKQLGLLALLSLAEQTALNSIGPYLPAMVASFPEIPDGEEGLYVGLLASAFALAQLATNLLWGYLSDSVGRKPVMLAGSLLLGACFAFFGFCSAYWQAVVVHVAMGLLNGNAAVVPTVLGEATDRSNQSRAFTWLPVMYSIGSITGPAVGGLLVRSGGAARFPFLLPNLCSAGLLVVSVVVLGIWFDETLDDAERKAAGWSSALVRWAERVSSWCCCCCGRPRSHGRMGSWSSRWPTSSASSIRGAAAVDHGDEDETNDDEDEEEGENLSDVHEDDDDEASSLLPPGRVDGAADPKPSANSSASHLAAAERSLFQQILTRNTVIVLVTYLVFQLSNISFNSLYPIFAAAPPPAGRALSPGTIGVLLSLAGAATIVFQVTVFQPLKSRMGNLGTYRWALLGLAVSMALMPWVGYRDDDHDDDGGGNGGGAGRWSKRGWWLYAELAVVLVVKNICAVGGLSSVMLLITNCAPSHETLGTLNGIAQTLSAAGRSFGPFVSGGLFTLSMRVEPRGELLAWGVFAGVSLAGWLGTLAIKGKGLESGDWVGGSGSRDGGEVEEDEEDGLDRDRDVEAGGGDGGMGGNGAAV